jgi:epoxyqueuosine reductase
MLSAAAIKEKARELRFDLCGIAPAEGHPELEFFRTWIDRGYAGNMSYLVRSAERRGDVRRVLPSARSVIATATVYNVDRPYSTECRDPDRAHIARYAWGDDYHDVIGERLDRLLAWMRTASSESFEARTYVDTGPVQERVYAQYAGIGWIGKNTCLINAEAGSWIFLAEIICSLPLEVDSPAFDQCGTCTLCLEACPTRALVAPGVLDATRCISYLTIELRDEIAAALQPGLGSQVYGCDICQEVCPWNARPALSTDPAWQPRAVWDRPSLTALAQLSDEDLRRALRHSPMRRARVDGLRRNIQTARKNVVAGVRS